MSSNLSSKQSQLVTYEQLIALPTPAPLGRLHQPVPHKTLVDTLRTEAISWNLTIERETFAIAAKGDILFGVMDFRSETDSGWLHSTDRGLSLGFRSANNQAFGISAVAGARVFVCDNMALSGDMFAIQRKHTIRLDLTLAIHQGFERFAKHAVNLREQIALLEQQMLSDAQAKALIYDVFAGGILPARLFDDVHGFYFTPGDDMLDCQPRSKWGVHNALTRAIKELSPTRGFNATIAVGRALGMTQKATEGLIIDTTHDDSDKDSE